MVQRHSAAECLRSPLDTTLPTRCQQLKRGFGDCRRGMVDMRKRFRGNQPVTFDTLNASGADGRYQLYAGRPAFPGTARKTDGNEPEPPDWREEENKKYRQERAKEERS